MTAVGAYFVERAGRDRVFMAVKIGQTLRASSAVEFHARCGMCHWLNTFASDTEAFAALDRHEAAHRRGAVSFDGIYPGEIEPGMHFWWQQPFAPVTEVVVDRMLLREGFEDMVAVKPAVEGERLWSEQRAVVSAFRRYAVPVQG